MMVSANNAQAILKKKANFFYSFVMYEYVNSRQLRSEMAAAINGSNGYTQADISSAQIRRGKSTREMPQLNFHNFSTSQGPYSV
jgi:hypothetical protein